MANHEFNTAEVQNLARSITMSAETLLSVASELKGITERGDEADRCYQEIESIIEELNGSTLGDASQILINY